MVIKLIKRILRITTFSTFLYLFFILLKDYNSIESIEKRCTIKFHKDLDKDTGKSDYEWGLNMDIANENYFRCIKIP